MNEKELDGGTVVFLGMCPLKDWDGGSQQKDLPAR